jgi:hypothetical protein
MSGQSYLDTIERRTGCTPRGRMWLDGIATRPW